MLNSLLIIFFLGLGAKKLFEKFKLPGLVGLVLVGILTGPFVLNLLEQDILALSTEIRLLALIIILLRAGLGLDRQILTRIGSSAIKMSAIPGIFEGTTIMILSRIFLDFSWAQAGVLGFIIAAVSPAVVVPSMLDLRDRGLGMDKNVPILILAGASIDDVFAITVFTVFLGLAGGTATEATPLISFAMIPVEIVGGVLLGLIIGYLLVLLFNRFTLHRIEQLLLVTGSGIVVTLIGEAVSLAGLLAVMGLGFILLEKGNGHDYISQLEESLNHLWLGAQLFLFILIGAAVNIQVAWQAGALGIMMIALGLTARSIGVLVATWRSGLSWNERKFCAAAYLPKATVQAAIGGVPLAAGIPGGEIILAIAVLSIIITAPLGAIAIKRLAPRLLNQCELTEGGEWKVESQRNNDN
ncbi:cation:proton antiporter domain-containing protein [Dethiobacter alkaliphilus]|uniref:Sodium/hydrogen exchanger n=1 Tax=Dethiobacter alkaliphilus AHT 1 TaxID=555088 RepID=C0GJU6_DETAL|nr:cation:proton antiporter [Dethiobacter alkaliphilus]EEG76404.1 sodium/hydrogen exchanger [Dethiobacter alkaliphilus AHT 1]